MDSQPPIRILLVDDHQMMRDGLRSILDLEDDLDVVIGQRGGGNNGALIIPTIDVFHESLSSVSD